MGLRGDGSTHIRGGLHPSQVVLARKLGSQQHSESVRATTEGSEHPVAIGVQGARKWG